MKIYRVDLRHDLVTSIYVEAENVTDAIKEAKEQAFGHPLGDDKGWVELNVGIYDVCDFTPSDITLTSKGALK